MLGDINSGKTQLFHELYDNTAKTAENPFYVKTFKQKELDYGNRKVWIKLQESFDTFSTSLTTRYENVDFVIFVYNINEGNTFNALSNIYIPFSKKLCKENVISKFDNLLYKYNSITCGISRR